MKKTVNTLINLSLLALALVALVSCDNESSVPGGLVTMKIDFRGMETGSSEELRSASSEIVSSQRIVLPSGEEWQVDLSIDPESPLRAGPLNSTSYIRLLAIDGSGNLVRYVDWRQDVGEVPDLYIPNTYSSCYFVCYSYNNNSTNTLPSGYTEGSILPALSVRDGGSNELLLWRSPSAVAISDGGSVGSVLLKRQLTQVKLKLDCLYEGKNITAVSTTTPIALVAGVTGNTYSLVGGGLVTAVSSSDLPFTWLTSTFGGTTVTSDPLALVPQTGFSLKIPAGAITLQAGVTQNTLTSIPFPTSQLAAGKTHTIRVQLVKTSFARFANSNIYWDGNKLTFDEYIYPSDPDYASRVSEQEKQGVGFKWGSLIGISTPGQAGAAQHYWSNDSTIYVPVDPANPSTNHTAWVKTTTSAAVAAGRWSPIGYTNIPFVAFTEYSGPSNDRANDYLTTTLHSPTSTAAYKGDICQYLNSAYRMPRSEEFPNATYWSSTSPLPDFHDLANYFATAIDGQTAIAKSDHRGLTLTTATTGSGGLFFPTSGRRDRSGVLEYVSTIGFYWSSSANIGEGYWLHIRQGLVSPEVTAHRGSGQPVRCVLQ